MGEIYRSDDSDVRVGQPEVKVHVSDILDSHLQNKIFSSWGSVQNSSGNIVSRSYVVCGGDRIRENCLKHFFSGGFAHGAGDADDSQAEEFLKNQQIIFGQAAFDGMDKPVK